MLPVVGWERMAAHMKRIQALLGTTGVRKFGSGFNLGTQLESAMQYDQSAIRDSRLQISIV